MRKPFTVLAGLAAKLPAAIPDAMIVAGVGAISYGAWLIQPAAGFITGGVLALILGVSAAISAAKKAEK